MVEPDSRVISRLLRTAKQSDKEMFLALQARLKEDKTKFFFIEGMLQLHTNVYFMTDWLYKHSNVPEKAVEQAAEEAIVSLVSFAEALAEAKGLSKTEKIKFIEESMAEMLTLFNNRKQRNDQIHKYVNDCFNKE